MEDSDSPRPQGQWDCRRNGFAVFFRKGRFCYVGCNWDTRLNAPTKLQVDIGRHGDYTGYMVFPGPGLTRLTATDSNGATHSVVIEVP